MDPRQLIAPPGPLPYPAPYWLLTTFKVTGFALHMAAMHLWLAGVPLAMVLGRRSGEHGRILSRRLASQMPIIIALGINFGIVPLLFTQVALGRVFYPATILMAWPWFGIVALLMLAYYGVYLYAIGLRRLAIAPWQQAAGWAAALLFLMISFVFTNGFSLMTNIHAWPALWRQTSAAGAPLGIALNTGDPTLLPRWLMVLGLALTTAAAYAAADAGLFAFRETQAYRRWACRFALRLYTLGVAWYAVAGAWYALGTWPEEVKQAMLRGPVAALTALTAASPVLVWALIRASRRRPAPGLGRAIALAQLGVIVLNAVSRQVVQSTELRRFVDLAAGPAATQWGPLVVFLLLLAAGLSAVVWMLHQAAAAARRPQVTG
jgi:hypothetical protein